MGNSLNKPLSQVSAEELATAVAELGANYVDYSKAILDNAVDGELLDSFEEKELLETLQDLNVTNRLHQRVFVKEWKKLKERNETATANNNETQSEFGKSKETNHHSQSKIPTSAQKSRELLQHHPVWQLEPVQTKLSKTEIDQILGAANEYDLSESTAGEELTGFGRIVDSALEKCQAIHAAVNLFDADGHLSLASRIMRRDDQSISKERMHVPKEMSLCHRAMMERQGRDFVTFTFPASKTPLAQLAAVDGDVKYIGHVAKSEQGVGVAMVCAVVEEDVPSNEEILRELAAEAEQQLKLRKVLLQRNHKLKSQIDQSTVLPASVRGVKAVNPSDIVQRKPSPFPMPEELGDQPPRTAKLPVFSDGNQATAQEMSHMPDDYFDLMDRQGVDRTPVHKNDMERVAFLEALGLKEMTPEDPTAQALVRLTDLACRLFEVNMAEVMMLTHSTTLSLATSFFGPDELKDEIKQKMLSVKNVCSKRSDGEPWVCSMPRGFSFCNFVIYTGQTFTSHDVWKDESFQWLREANFFRFYSGAPVIINGKVVATLCLYDFQRPRPDFGTVHQIQQEQIAQTVAQHLEIWALRRDMVQLEEMRVRLGEAGSKPKMALPEGDAAIMFTDVQGSTSLWEADPDAMHEALNLHNQVIRKFIAQYHGYEVTTEGDAFVVAFHDCVDAVSFALNVQIALHQAPWSDAILALPDAHDDRKGMRGLRVRMAIHHGSVISRENEVSKRIEFTGQTVNVAKSLEHLAHGGQILVTSDVWKVASYFCETQLGSPQVLDLGVYILLTGTKLNEGIIAKGVVQLVPSSLAHSYKPDSMSGQGNESISTGRVFPPPMASRRRLSASFHEAPRDDNNLVAMAFVYTSQVEKQFDESSLILAALAKQIGNMLGMRSGYQCKDFMLAFPTVESAILFGLKLEDYLQENAVAEAELAGLLQFGIHKGHFTSLVPDKTTGRADYFGKVVNRAARVAAATEPGRVFLGMVEDGEPDIKNSAVETKFVEARILKGVQEEMSLFSCSWKQ